MKGDFLERLDWFIVADIAFRELDYGGIGIWISGRVCFRLTKNMRFGGVAKRAW